VAGALVGASAAPANRRASTSIVNDNLDKMLLEIQRLTEEPTLFAPRHHSVLPADINAQRLEHVLRTAHEQCPRDFEALLGLPGVGPATVRSLSLLAELIYAAPASHRDPAAPLPSEAVAAREATTAAADSQATACPPPRKWADYSYAHGGKDGHPFPVDRSTYDRNIAVLTDAVRKARVGQTDKVDALKRLARLASSTVS
jgi:hypothetical protein